MSRRLLDASRDRLRRLRRALRERHVAAYLATSPVEVAYLSNFGGEDGHINLAKCRRQVRKNGLPYGFCFCPLTFWIFPADDRWIIY